MWPVSIRIQSSIVNVYANSWIYVCVVSVCESVYAFIQCINHIHVYAIGLSLLFGEINDTCACAHSRESRGMRTYVCIHIHVFALKVKRPKSEQKIKKNEPEVKRRSTKYEIWTEELFSAKPHGGRTTRAKIFYQIFSLPGNCARRRLAIFIQIFWRFIDFLSFCELCD